MTLSPEDKIIWEQLTILDGVEFLHDHVLPKLEIHPVDEEVILHPNCSARRIGLDVKMYAIAQKCVKNAIVPLALGHDGHSLFHFPDIFTLRISPFGSC